VVRNRSGEFIRDISEACNCVRALLSVPAVLRTVLGAKVSTCKPRWRYPVVESLGCQVQTVQTVQAVLACARAGYRLRRSIRGLVGLKGTRVVFGHVSRVPFCFWTFPRLAPYSLDPVSQFPHGQGFVEVRKASEGEFAGKHVKWHNV
jgi:hypothetical protein